MIHEDGIEVYLKPVGPNSDNLRVAEFPLEDVQINGQPDSERNKRCVILARAEAFQVVVRVKESFKMYAANALVYSIDGYTKPTTPDSSTMQAFPRDRIVIQRSWAHEQRVRKQIIWESRPRGPQKGSGTRHEMSLLMRQSAQGIAGLLDELQPAEITDDTSQEGTILIAVYRSSVQWEGDAGWAVNKSLYGPGDPTAKRTHVRGSRKPLASKNGKSYFFEFRYRSRNFVSTLQETLLKKQSTLKPTESAIDLVQDNDFVTKREEDRRKREKLSAGYWEQQRHIATTVDKAEGRQSAAVTPKGIANGAEGPPPKFCDCPDPAHKQSVRKSTSTPGSKSPKVLGSTRPSPDVAVASPNEYITDEELEDESESVEPAVAPTCMSCKNLKVAKYKRPAFLRQWNLYRAVSSGQIPREESALPLPSDSGDLGNGREDTLPPVGSAQETSRKESDSDQDLPTEDTSLHGESIVAPSSGKVAGGWPTTADVEHTVPASDSTADSSDANGPPLETPTAADLVEAVSDEKQAGGADVNRGNSQAVQNVPPTQKRSAEALLDPRPLKQHRQAIDAVEDRAESLITVKEEQVALSETNPIAIQQEDEADDELQAKLEDIDRELRIERLEKQRAEIVRKQKQKQKEAAMKRINAVKVKKEIIEIEDD